MGTGLPVRKIPAYLLLLVLQLMIAGCSQSPPEEAIRHALDELEQAIEDGDTGTIMDRLTDNANVSRGHPMNRKELQRTLIAAFFRYPKRQVTLAGIRIEVDPVSRKTARVRFTAIVWGGRNLLPENGDSYQVDSHWVYDGNWKIVSLDASGQ